MNILLLHGNGGANSRFQLLFDLHRQSGNKQVQFYLPLLPGFEGRSLPGKEEQPDRWAPFMEAMNKAVSARPNDRWIFYGHGIGGSILLEWMARNWQPGPRVGFQPERIILHAPIGASLADRFFPKLMKPKLIRKFVHWLIYQPWLREQWKKKLFLHPERIPSSVINQFFADYRSCTAFPVFFDLITPTWYQNIKSGLGDQSFHFLWGARERVVASKYLDYWKKDFPKSQFEIISDWDHFPMLEQPEDYYQYLVQLFSTDQPVTLQP